MIDNSLFWSLFHNAWGQAKESPEYDKQIWCQLDLLVSRKFPLLTHNHASSVQTEMRLSLKPNVTDSILRDAEQ